MIIENRDKVGRFVKGIVPANKIIIPAGRGR